MPTEAGTVLKCTTVVLPTASSNLRCCYNKFDQRITILIQDAKTADRTIEIPSFIKRKKNLYWRDHFSPAKSRALFFWARRRIRHPWFQPYSFIHGPFLISLAARDIMSCSFVRLNDFILFYFCFKDVLGSFVIKCDTKVYTCFSSHIILLSLSSAGRLSLMTIRYNFFVSSIYILWNS